MDSLGHTIRQASRRLRKTPGFTVTALLTLAVGIGANTAIFSLIYTVLLEPLPFREPDRLVSLWHTAPGLEFEELNQAPATYLTYRADSELLEDVALWRNETVSISGLGDPEEVPSLLVSDAFLPLLGVQPALGRGISREDDTFGAPPVVLLGHGYWERALGADPAIVGKTIRVDGTVSEIIGVLPEGFRFMDRDPGIIYPARFDLGEVFFGQFSYQAFGRMRPGVTPAQVAAELEPLTRVALDRYPGPITLPMFEQARFGQIVRPLKDDLVGDVGQVLWVLLGTVGIVLLIACANVANLFLVRAEGRVRDVAIRRAVGAGPGHIATQFLSESVLLGLIAGAGGVAIAWGGIRLLTALEADLPRVEELSIGWPVLLFALVVSVVAGLLFGALPLLRYGSPNLPVALKDGLRGSTSGIERNRAQRSLVVVQVALALVLLVGAGLLIRTFQELRRVDPGFTDPHEVFTFRVSFPEAVVEDPVELAVMEEEIHRRLAELPEVVSVGASSSITMDGYYSDDPVFIEDFPTPPGEIPNIRRLKFVYPGYFETIGNRLIAGRTLEWSDIQTRADVAVVTEDFAREHWGDPSLALDERIAMLRMDDAPLRYRRIIGVVGNSYDDGVDQGPVATVYWPAVMYELYEDSLGVQRSLVYALRLRNETTSGLLPRVQQAVWEVNPSLPVANARTLGEIHDGSMARTSFALTMLAIAAFAALFLSAVGLYGVISYSVSQKVREIGVRMALGAPAAQVRSMIVRQGMTLTAIGLVIGGLAAFGLARVLSALLFGVQPGDPLTFAGVAAVLAVVSLLASDIPARRASALDPGATLRQE